MERFLAPEDTDTNSNAGLLNTKGNIEMSEINDKGTNAVEGADQDASGHIRAFQTPAEPDTIRALMGEADEDTSGHIRAY